MFYIITVCIAHQCSKWCFRSVIKKRAPLRPVTFYQLSKMFFIPLYTTDISTKFEDIPFIRLGGDTDLRFKFPKSHRSELENILKNFCHIQKPYLHTNRIGKRGKSLETKNNASRSQQQTGTLKNSIFVLIIMFKLTFYLLITGKASAI